MKASKYGHTSLLHACIKAFLLFVLSLTAHKWCGSPITCPACLEAGYLSIVHPGEPTQKKTTCYFSAAPCLVSRDHAFALIDIPLRISDMSVSGVASRERRQLRNSCFVSMSETISFTYSNVMIRACLRTSGRDETM